MLPKLVIVAAVSRNRVIGHNGEIPWYLPEDHSRFKAIAPDNPVVMGRKTWESLPKAPLPGRINYVLSRRPGWKAEGAQRVRSLDDVLSQESLSQTNEVMVIGGEALYREALPRADRLELTEVQQNVDGDAFFPEFDGLLEWQPVSRVFNRADSTHPAYDYVTYLRRPTLLQWH